jgi:hypothetical protein
VQTFLAQLAAYLIQILGIDRAILSELRRLAGIVEPLGDTAVESSRFSIEDIAFSTAGTLTDPVYGLPAINTTLNLVALTIQGTGLPTIADVLAAIGNVNPVTLPETPPAGYGGTVIGEILAWQLCALD